MPDTGALTRALETQFAHRGRQPHSLLQILIALSREFGWISPDAVQRIADTLGISQAQVRGVINFYGFLHDRDLGRYQVLFSDNIIEQLQGSRALMHQLCEQLQIKPRSDAGGLAFVGLTSCIGMGDQGPAALVNGRTLTGLDSDRIQRMAQLIKSETPLESWPEEWFRVDDNIHRRDSLLQTDSQFAGEALTRGLTMDAEALLAEVHASGLRGRGGAGFPTGRKWRACAEAPLNPNSPGKQTRYVVCNADEGEPGTFKDRALLAGHAELVFAGMTLCARAIGASRGIIYLRGEYEFLRPGLEALLEQRRTEGLLGENILGSDTSFDITIHSGAGAYVCGEETALLESLEGRRGIPRIRPPLPVHHGYLGQPTVVNNVETFANVPLLIAQGADVYAARGTSQSSGTKLVSVSGDCARAGVYEYPFGTPLSQVLDDCGADNPGAVWVGGAAGFCVTPNEFQRRMAFEDAPSTGAIMIFNTHRDIIQVARNFIHFFAHESCGFCTPCRVGTSLLARLADKIAEGRGSKYDLESIKSVARLLRASHCGLGVGAALPILETTKKFGVAYNLRLASRDFIPAFNLDDALASARDFSHRDDPAAHLSN